MQIAIQCLFFFFLLSNPFLFGMCNIVMKHAEQKFSPFDRLEK